MSIYRLASLVIRFAPPIRLLINQLSCLLSVLSSLLRAPHLCLVFEISSSKAGAFLHSPPGSCFSSLPRPRVILRVPLYLRRCRPRSILSPFTFPEFFSLFRWSNCFSFPRVPSEPNSVSQNVHTFTPRPVTSQTGDPSCMSLRITHIGGDTAIKSYIRQ